MFQGLSKPYTLLWVTPPGMIRPQLVSRQLATLAPMAFLSWATAIWRLSLLLWWCCGWLSSSSLLQCPSCSMLWPENRPQIHWLDVEINPVTIFMKKIFFCFYLLFYRQAMEETDSDPSSSGRWEAVSIPNGAVEALLSETLLQLEIQCLVWLQVWGQGNIYLTTSSLSSIVCAMNIVKVFGQNSHF